MKPVLIKALKFAVSFAILGYLFYKARQNDNFREIASSTKQWEWILFGVFAGLMACMIGFVRWFVLVRALAVKLTFGDAMRLGFLGHLFNLMSIGVLGGDALKCVFVAKHVGDKKTEAVLSIFADRAIGLVTMFSVAAIAFWICDFSKFDASNPNHFAAIQYFCQIVTSLAIIGLISMIVFFAIPNVAEARVLQPITRLRWIGGFFSKFLGVVSAYRKNPLTLIVAFLMSIGINVLFACAIFGVAAGISDSHPTFPQHLVIAPIAMVANAVPLPGGIGGMEFALDYLYRGFAEVSLPAEHGFVVALGFRLILLFVALIGIFVYLSRRKEFKQLTEQIHSEPDEMFQPDVGGRWYATMFKIFRRFGHQRDSISR